MTQITLHDYLQHINQLLEDNRLSEVVAHCRHILESHPRHVDSYRLLGRALLEQQKHDDAADVFQRVLSADPEDFVAYVVLAEIYKAKGALPQATWYMERALEMEPYQAAIQQELKELYSQRDGLKPAQLFLTRGALARLYFRGGLYQQAAAELRQVLSNGEERLDLQVLLAESLWRDDQRVDAVEVGLDVLSKLPDCIKANAILAEVWLITGRIDEAQEYLHRILDLTLLDATHCDPETAVGQAFGADGAIPLPKEILIEELDYVPGGAGESEDASDWVRELGLSEGEADGNDNAADWLSGLGDAQEEDPFSTDAFAAFGDASEGADAQSVPDAEADGGEMLDWLRDVAAGDEGFFGDGMGAQDGLDDFASAESDLPSDGDFDWFADETQNKTAGAQDDALDWFSDSSEQPSSADAASDKPDNVPDWMQEFVNDEPASGGTGMTDWLNENDLVDSETAVSKSSDDQSDDIPDWLSDEAALGEEVVDGAGTDWLSQTAGDLSAGDFATETEDELPDWLSDSSSDFSALDFANETEDGLPDWLAESSDDLTAVDSETDDELPDWLAESSDDLTAVETETEDELPDWLAETSDDLTAVDSEPEDELPDWLAESSDDLMAVDSETEDELPDWLAESSDDLTAVETETEDELPDWLAESSDDLTAVDSETEDELPDWLAESSDDLTAVETELEDELPDWLAESSDDLTAVDSEPEDEPAEIEMEAEPLERPADVNWDEPDTENEINLIESRTDVNDADIPAWLLGDYEPMEDQTMGASDHRDEDSQGVPDDFDDAMAWLEKLAADQGAPLDELPTYDHDTAPAESADSPAAAGDLPDWLKMEIEATPAAGDDAPDWLQALDPGEVAIDETDWMEMADDAPDTAVDDLFDAMDEADDHRGSALPNTELPDWLRQQMPDNLDEDKPQARQRDAGHDDLGWLDQIAAGEGAAIDEPPTLSWDEVEAAADDTNIGWLDDLINESGPEMPIDLLEDSVDSEIPAADSAETLFATADDSHETEPVEEAWLGDGIPDDPDDAMAWLEQLAAQQGAPLDELPSVDRYEEDDTLLEAALTTEDLSFSWDDDAAEEVVDQTDSEMIETAVSFIAEDELPITEADSDVGIPDDSDDAMSWLDDLSAEQGTLIDELTSVVDEPPVTEALSAAVADETEPVDEAEQLFADTSDEIPDDPDDAMAWLERLAAQQGAPLDELPTVDQLPPLPVVTLEDEAADVDEVDLMDIVASFEDEEAFAPELDLMAETSPAESSDDFLDDPDEAMAWLERLATDQDALLDDLPALFEGEVVEETPTPVVASEILEARAAAELDSTEEEDVLPVVEPAETAMADFPDDDDDAAAWLEKLAARQGAPMDELLSAPVEGTDVDMPDWLAAEMADNVVEPEEVAPLEEATELEAEPEETAVPEMDLDWLPEPVAEIQFDEELDLDWDDEIEIEPVVAELETEVAPVEVIEAVEDDAFDGMDSDAGMDRDLAGQDIADSLPDWLSFEPTGEASNEDVDWLDSFAQSDPGSWLAAEEEVTLHDPLPAASVQERKPEPEPERRRQPEVADSRAQAKPEPQPEASPVTQQPIAERMAEPEPQFEPVVAGRAAGMDQPKLETARRAMASRDYETSVAEYTQLLDSGEGLRVLITDLETAVANHNRQPLVRRLLGDAYMRNGQLQKALDMYRQALDQL